MPRTEAKQVPNCSPAEIAAFKELVIEADEVDPAGFDRRLARAERLIFLYSDDDDLVGVAAVKRPNEGHTRQVFHDANSPEDPSAYGFEIGWIVVKPAFRNRHFSRDLVEAALSVVGEVNVFATVRTNNEPMHRTNEGFGFQLSGNSFPTTRQDRDYSLSLFIKPKGSS